MIHINDGHGLALCKNTDGPLVGSALESDCEDCRALAMICPVNERGSEVREALDYEQEPPMVDASGRVYAREKP